MGWQSWGDVASRHLHSNFSLLGKLGPLLRRATLAVSTGMGCLACTAHAKAFLLFAFLRELSPSPRAAASRSRLLGMLASLHPRLPAPKGVSWGWEPLRRAPVGWWRAGSRQEGGEAALPLLISAAQDLRLLFFFLKCFLLVPDLAPLQSYSLPLVISHASSPCSQQSLQIRK